MTRGLFALAAIFALVAAAPKISDKPVGAAETAFVQSVQKDLNARFATPADAENAGYFRYNNEDKTGAISYVNLQSWNSTDPQHPSQLWYSASGKLLGADYSIPIANDGTCKGKTPPNQWGVNPQRWFCVRGPHVHYVLKNSDGTYSYGHAVRAKQFVAAGGNLDDPKVDTLVKMGVVKDAGAVSKIFTFPGQWNLELWVTPNPNGAFAETNPLVHPSKNAGSSEM
jgi:hypothetical protein